MENSPAQKEKDNEKEVPPSYEDGIDYEPMPGWASDLAKKAHHGVVPDKELLYPVEHVDYKTLEKEKTGKSIFSSFYDRQSSDLALVPMEEVSPDDHVGKDFLKPKPDVWDRANKATPVKKMEKEIYSKKSQPAKKPILKNSPQPMEHFKNIFSEEKGDLVKTPEDAEKIAKIKERYEAEKLQMEQDKKQTESVYEKLKALFQKPKIGK